MNKVLSLLLISFISMSSIVACSSRDSTDDCEKADGTRACYDESSKKYLIEDGAKIRIGLDNDEWGKAIVEEWNKEHPDHQGVVEFLNVESANASGLITDQQANAPDVLLVIDGETIAHQQSMYTLEDHLAKIVKQAANQEVFKNINKTTIYYVPMAVDGLTFIWNKTMLEELGLKTLDSNNDYLPDEYDTWEEIFDLANEWAKSPPIYKGKKITITFPLAINDTWHAYSALTAGGWEIFEGNDPTRPEYDQESFLKGLEFIAELGKNNIALEQNGTKTPGVSLVPKMDEMLNSEISPFGLVGSWIDIESAEQITSSKFVVSKLPTYNETQLTPFFKTKGFVINGFTKYPSAAHELLRMLYSKEGLQVMSDHSPYVPALNKVAKNEPDLTDNLTKLQMQYAFNSNYLEPVGLSLPNNPQKGAMYGYYDLGLNEIFIKVYDGAMTPSSAQKEILSLYDSWLKENNK